MPVTLLIKLTWTPATVGEAKGVLELLLLHAAGPRHSAEKISTGVSSERAAHENRSLFTSRPCRGNSVAQNWVSESDTQGNQSFVRIPSCPALYLEIGCAILDFDAR